MYTISRVAKLHGLSRSTLLYYDSIGLLTPRKRTGSNHRLYSEEDLERLEQIRLYRETGVPLKKIARLLKGSRSDAAQILEDRLLSINREMAELREQQRTLLHLLQDKRLRSRARLMDKETWVSMLRAAGLDSEGMATWHQAFEAQAPEGHQDFLESLALSTQEIRRIRKASKAPKG